MTVEKLIEALMALPMDMEVGATNYYGDFGPVTGITIEVSRGGSYTNSEVANATKGKKVALIDLDLDMQ